MKQQQDDNQMALATRPTEADATSMIVRAVADPTCDPAKLRELLSVRREWEADEARAQFNAAVVLFQQKCPIIEKGDKAYDKMYARIDRIWRTIRPLMEECGLAVTWESVLEKNGVCVLEGHLRHKRGHAQPLHHEVPLPDLIKGQNATQRGGAGETYAKRYALCAALGIQTGDDDTDGACERVVTDDQVEWLREAIQYTTTDLAKFLTWGGCKALEAFPADKFGAAEKMLRAKGAK
jgi:hypothetical protein